MACRMSRELGAEAFNQLMYDNFDMSTPVLSCRSFTIDWMKIMIIALLYTRVWTPNSPKTDNYGVCSRVLVHVESKMCYFTSGRTPIPLSLRLVP